jgi:hypothetical protein
MKAHHFEPGGHIAFIALGRPGESWQHIFPSRHERVLIVGKANGFADVNADIQAAMAVTPEMSMHIDEQKVNSMHSRLAYAMRIPARTLALEEILTNLEEKNLISKAQHHEARESLNTGLHMMGSGI